MCNKRNSTEIPYGNQANVDAKVDDCIAKEIIRLNKKGIITLASCCGHNGIYKKSIVVLCKDKIRRKEYFSKKVILNRKRFYKKDIYGYYYIP